MCRYVLPLLLAICLIAISGCLEAEKYSDVTYDAKTDTFKMLRVYYHMHSTKEADRDYLVALWNNRDHILPIIPVEVLGEYGLLRAGEAGTLLMPIATQVEKPKTAAMLPFDAGKIVNKPGKFFLTPEKTLAYYHVMEIPGSEVDKGLEFLRVQGCGQVGNLVARENTRRADGGGKAPWTRIKTELLAIAAGEIAEPDPAAPAPAVPGILPFNALSEESLKLLEKAAADKSLTLSRKGTVLTASFPATAADRKSIIEIFSAVKEKFAATPEAKRTGDITLLFKTLAATKATEDEKAGTLVVTLDLQDMRKSWGEIPGMFDLKAAVKKESVAACNETLARLSAAQIEVDETLKLEEIPAMFEKGTLPVDSPKKPVAAGTGLFKTRDEEPVP